MPVRNRADFLGTSLQSILSIDYPAFEVIVVDNGSTDGSGEIASRYPVKLVREERQGSYAARNTGVGAAEGEILAFTDSDCVVHKDWLKMLIRHYSGDDIGGVCGEILSYRPASLVERFCDVIGVNRVDLINKIERKVTELKRNPRQFLSADFVTANCSFRKSVFLEAGKFDEAFQSGGDVGFGWEVLRKGYRLIYEPDSIVWHYHRTTLSGLIKIFYKYGKDQPLLVKKLGKRSFFKIKTYILEPYEFSALLPIQMLVNIDLFSLLILSLVLIPVSRFFAWAAVAMAAGILLGTLRHTVRAMRQTGEIGWLVTFPFLQIVRNYSFIFGRIVGGVRHRIISI